MGEKKVIRIGKDKIITKESDGYYACEWIDHGIDLVVAGKVEIKVGEVIYDVLTQKEELQKAIDVLVAKGGK